ncbi:MAG: aminodeoxychorismate synthase component I [Paludibacter sp.]
MSENFPYNLIKREQLIEKMNRLSSSGKPFLFIIDYNAENGYMIEKDELDEQFIRFSINNSTNQQINKSTNQQINWEIKPVKLESYKLKFDFVVEQIKKGNSFLTNLTQPTELNTNLSLSDLFQIGSAKYKLWLKYRFTVLSPETFVKIKDSTISSFPMKGTIDASIPNAEKFILNDPKEKAEHATIVDLIRNDLSLVAEQVEVKRYRYIDKINTNKQDLLQVSSEITGQLPQNFREKLGNIIFALLPAGSISGAPKKKTLKIIEEVEGYKRGFYTGIWGWFDGKDLDSAVMIRYIEQNGNQLIFKSGGGITSQSDLNKEYDELIQKVYVPIC